MSLNWKELLKSSPHELVISGPKHSKQLEDEDGLNDIIFRIYSLNFMEVSKTSLEALPMKIKELENLTALMLYDNKLTQIPKEIGLLKKLKTLDLSNNQLDNLPNELSQLTGLQSLNIINNKISKLPKDLTNWSNLIVIKFSHNKFTEFPQSLCNVALKQHLTEIHATDNEISNLPMEIGNLSALKTLDLTNNKITLVPGELSDCVKIKTLSLQNNPIKDVRLHKLVEKNPTKQILQHIAKNCPRGGATQAGGKGAKSRKKTDSSNSNNEQEGGEAGGEVGEEAPEDREAAPKPVEERPIVAKRNEKPTVGTVEVLAVNPDNWFIIEVDSSILPDRKIVACIVRNLSFADEPAVKRFLTVQTNLHDTICGRRELATIATHDLAKLTPRVKLMKMLPHKIQLVPLNRGGKSMSGQELYKVLNQEADAYRKEKKRASYSGIHKYLYLLKGKTHYPVVVDGSGSVITLPPLTNAEQTKISTTTRDVLLEVTGSKTPDCKKVLDCLLHDMLKFDIASRKSDTDEGPTIQVEPVRVVRSDEDNKLFVVYPSKVDLLLDDIKIVRRFDA